MNQEDEASYPYLPQFCQQLFGLRKALYNNMIIKQYIDPGSINNNNKKVPPDKNNKLEFLNINFHLENLNKMNAAEAIFNESPPIQVKIEQQDEEKEASTTTEEEQKEHHITRDIKDNINNNKSLISIDDQQIKKKQKKIESIIEQYCMELGINDNNIICEANNICNRQIVLTQNLLRGKSNEDVAAACIYISSKKYSFPIIHKKFLTLKSIRERLFNKCIQLITKSENSNGVTIQPKLSPQCYIDKINSFMKFPLNITEFAKYIITASLKLQIIKEEYANTIAAAALKFACDSYHLKIINEELSQHAGITRGTLRNMHRTLFDHKDALLTEIHNLTKSNQSDQQIYLLH